MLRPRVTVNFQAAPGRRAFRQQLSVAAHGAERRTADRDHHRHHRQSRVRGRWASALTFRAHDALTLFVRGDNLADEQYDSALGYPGLPRALVAGARWTLGGRR